MLRRASALLLPLLGVVAGVRAQVEPKPAPTTDAAARAIDAWLASDLVDEQLLGKTVTAVLDDARGLAELGARLTVALTQPTERATKGLTALATHTVLGFIERARKSGMTFRGQYEPLRPLQPFATDLLFNLLLETPDWYPHSQRDRLLPPLRDLQATTPVEARLAGVLDLVAATETESADFRRALACLLWQWGRRERLQSVLDQLRRDSAEGDAEDRLQSLRQLAQLAYEVADYERAAQTWSAVAKLAEHGKLPLYPNDWYWTACCHALRGDVEHGIAALEQCATLQTSPGVDESRRLPRKLFEQDPEIARLRADARFAAILARAFPAAPTGGKGR